MYVCKVNEQLSYIIMTLILTKLTMIMLFYIIKQPYFLLAASFYIYKKKSFNHIRCAIQSRHCKCACLMYKTHLGAEGKVPEI